MATKLSHAELLRQASMHLQGALDPVAWAADQLGWHANQPWQIGLLRSSARQIAVRVGRQQGKSTTCAVKAAHKCVYEPGSLTVITSPRQAQASELLRKVNGFLSLPKLGVRFTSNAATSLETSTGSRVLSVPASPENIRGLSIDLWLADEAAFTPPELFDAMLPALAARPRSSLVMLSTPAAKSGAFWEACNSHFFEQYHSTAYDCPHIPRERLEQWLLEKGEHWFRREMLAEFSDAEWQFFAGDLIAHAFDCNAPALTGIRLFT